jgi:uncharacterized membrane protein
MRSIISSITPLLQYVVIAFAVVIIAMIVDLVAGLYKAKLRGEARRSELLKRTVYKFTLYEGGLCIAALIDICFFLCHGFELAGLQVLHGVPVVSFLVAIFICFVEGLSVREKADNKLHSEISRAEELAKQVLSHDEWINALTDAISRAQAKDRDVHAQQGAQAKNTPQGKKKRRHNAHD